MPFTRSNVPTYASFSDLVGNGRRFRVPPFQRDYKWTEENWDELWGDILEIEKRGEDEHFLGTIVLRQSNDAVSEIIDGQQRIATLSRAYPPNLRFTAKAGSECRNAWVRCRSGNPGVLKSDKKRWPDGPQQSGRSERIGRSVPHQGVHSNLHGRKDGLFAAHGV